MIRYLFSEFTFLPLLSYIFFFSSLLSSSLLQLGLMECEILDLLGCRRSSPEEMPNYIVPLFTAFCFKKQAPTDFNQTSMDIPQLSSQTPRISKTQLSPIRHPSNTRLAPPSPFPITTYRSPSTPDLRRPKSQQNRIQTDITSINSLLTVIQAANGLKRLIKSSQSQETEKLHPLLSGSTFPLRGDQPKPLWDELKHDLLWVEALTPLPREIVADCQDKFNLVRELPNFDQSQWCLLRDSLLARRVIMRVDGRYMLYSESLKQVLSPQDFL